MKTEYQYLNFVQQPSNGVTSRWSCRNTHHGDELGIVKWHGAWRQYCYFPTIQAVYSAGCLENIAEFIHQLSNLRTKNNGLNNRLVEVIPVDEPAAPGRIR